MTRSWQAPRGALGLDVRAGALLACARRASETDEKITPTVLIVAAVARALREHPRLNALVTDQGIEELNSVNIAVAVHTEQGLMTPVLRDVPSKSHSEIARELREKADAARLGKLPPSAYQGGGFTISSLATAGIDWVTPILNPPQVGILGVGRTRDAVVAKDGNAAIEQMSTLTLVFDHRAIDGYPAGLFLRDLGALIESPDDIEQA